MNRVRSVVIVTTCLLTLFTLLAPESAAAGQGRAWTSYAVSASAVGVHIATVIPNGPADDALVVADAPRARAVVDNLGRSTADAAAIAPGETIRSLRGVAANLAAGPLPMLPVPDIPLVAESSHPTVREADDSTGPVILTATSDPSDSAGSAGWAGTVTSGVVTASAAGNATSALVAEANTDIRNFAAGPVTIGRVTSMAQVRRKPGGALERTSALDISGLAIDGAAVALGPGRPIATDVVTISYLEPVESGSGMLAPGLMISVAVPASFDDGPSAVVFTLGRAEATIHSVAAPAGADPATASPPPPWPPGDPDSQAPPLPRPGAPVERPTPDGAPSGGEPSVDVALPRTAGGVLPTTPATQRVPATSGPWSLRWYLPMVVVGATLSTALFWFRRAGVRATWI